MLLTAKVTDCSWSHDCAMFKDPDIIIREQRSDTTFVETYPSVLPNRCDSESLILP